MTRLLGLNPPRLRRFYGLDLVDQANFKVHLKHPFQNM